MNNFDDVTYTLIFGITPNKDGTVKSIELSYVWDSKVGRTVSEFVPSKVLMDNAEKQFNEFSWDYILDEEGDVTLETGYCYFYSSIPDEVICSNDLNR